MEPFPKTSLGRITGERTETLPRLSGEALGKEESVDFGQVM